MGSSQNGSAVQVLPKQAEPDLICGSSAPLSFHDVRRDVPFISSAAQHGEIPETTADVIHRRIGWCGNENLQSAGAEGSEHLFQDKRFPGSRRSLNQNQGIPGTDGRLPCKALRGIQFFRREFRRFL